MTPERIETLIIGGGHAGLTMSHMLSQRDCSHCVVERHRIAERWRTERWRGLRFQFPNWSVRLPDFPFRHSDPDGFATPEEIVNFIYKYAEMAAVPVRCGVEVTALRRLGSSSFVADTSDGPIEATNVVVATGPYQRPVKPKILAERTDIFQLHTSGYTEPDQLPSGSVLIVGSGASGVQIAEELHRSGRTVFLSVGRHRRMPRRYRGHDLIWWLRELGLERTPLENRGPDRALPLITGAYGGYTIDFREFASRGIILLGKAGSASGTTMEFAPDLAENVAHGDAAYTGFLDLVDAHVERAGLDLPEEPEARIVAPAPMCLTAPMQTLDLSAVGVGAVIWATGYDFDFSWIDVPVLDECGKPVHRRGISPVPGIYFIGLPWLARMNSSFLSGVGEDAAMIADHIAGCGQSSHARERLSVLQTTIRV
jgi:putative flavoprotein involved in K+ transport